MLNILFLILPVIAIVFVLVGVVVFFAQKRQSKNKKTKSLIDSYIKERGKEQQSLSKELANLDHLLETNQIDEETHERLKHVLVTMKGKKNLDANDLYAYVSEKKKQPKN